MTKKLSRDFSKKDQEGQIQTFYVRYSTKNDFDSIVAYYNDNKHKDIDFRDLDILQKLVKKGQATIIEDQDNNIVACSVTYPCHSTNTTSSPEWQEVGSTRIKLNGYQGIFACLVIAQVFKSLIENPPKEFFVAHMVNPPVQDITRKFGWSEIENDYSQIVQASRKTLAKEDWNKDRSTDWFYCGEKGLNMMVKVFLSTIANPILKHYKYEENQKQIRISYDRCPLLKKLAPKLRENISKRQSSNANDNKYEYRVAAMAKAWKNTLR